MVKINVLTSKNYVQSTWSGGETTQVYLFPPQGRYELGQFDFRISTASVLLEQSNFSSLPGYQRIIMSLDHPIKLIHQNLLQDQSRVVHLQPFTVDFFDGAEKTTSFGQCQDFNLIYTDQYIGSMQAVYPQNKQAILPESIYFVYCLDQCEIEIVEPSGAKKIQCNQHDTVMIESEKEESGYVIMERQFPFCAPIAVEVTVKEVEDEHLVKGD